MSGNGELVPRYKTYNNVFKLLFPGSRPFVHLAGYRGDTIHRLW